MIRIEENSADEDNGVNSGASSASTSSDDKDIWQFPNSALRYAEFCGVEWYQKVIDTLIDHLPIDESDQLLDIGSGTGSGTCRLSERLKTPGFVIGIDSSRVQVEYASVFLPPDRPITFMTASLTEISTLLPSQVDGVVAFNSIHLLGELEQVFPKVAAPIKPGGYFGFCTGYATGAMEMAKSLAVRRVLEKVTCTAAKKYLFDSDSKSAGLRSGISAIRVKQLESQLTVAGFENIQLNWQEVALPAESVARFLTLPGMNALPQEIPSDDQYEMILDELRQSSIETLERKWLHVVAERRVS